MTRETKFGIVVAGSFVGLIGGVLAVKYFDPNHVATKVSPVVQAKPDDEKTLMPPPADPPIAPVTPLSVPPGALSPISTTPINTLDHEPNPVVLVPVSGDPAQLLPPSDNTPIDIYSYFSHTKSARCLIGSGLLERASTLMLATQKVRQKSGNFDPDLRMVRADGSASSPVVPMAPVLAPVDPTPGGIVVPPAPIVVPSVVTLPAVPMPDVKPMGGVTINPPDPAAVPMRGGSTSTTIGIDPVAVPKIDPVAVPKVEPVAVPKVDPVAVPKIDPVAVPKLGDAGLPTNPLDPPPVPAQPKPADSPAIKPMPVPMSPMITPAVETKPLDTRPAGVLGSPTVIADPNAPTFDPNRLRPAGPTETADSYEEEWYKCQEGESFSKISQTFYYTEKYEQSLRLYNLDRVGTDNLRQERPILRAGQTIRIPPARVLERKYSASVPGMKSGVAGMSGSSGGAPLATLGPVVPDRSDGGISPIEYEVTKPGMTLKDIAKEMLGSSDQWNRIFQLNRWLNSSEPVPVGAKIYVPRPTSR